MSNHQICLSQNASVVCFIDSTGSGVRLSLSYSSESSRLYGFLFIKLQGHALELAGLTGMAAGAAAGSVVPVVGTAVGAGVGFVAGAGGAWVATKTLEDFTDIGDNLREGLGDFLEDNFEEPLDAAWENVADAQDAAVEFASDTRDAAVDIVSDGIDSAEEALSEAGDALGNIGSRFKSWFD